MQLIVDAQTEPKPQPLGGSAARIHALKEYLEIFHDAAVLLIQCERELYFLFILIDGQLGACDRIINTVMDIEGGRIVIAHA